MARISRFFQKVFAGSASNNGQFGSAQTGAKLLTNDPATIQGLTAWDNGWLDATISGQRLPPLEEDQAVKYVQTRQLAYLLQEGVPEYDTSTTYYQHSIVKKSGTYQLYGSLIDNNTGHALPAAVSDSNWTYLGDLSALAGGGSYVPLAGGTMTGALVMNGAPINQAQGANVTAASTIDLDTGSDGNYVQINGNTTINRIVLGAGHVRILQFAGTPLLTYGTSGGGNNINLPGNADIPAAIGDRAIFVGKSDGIATCIAYTKNNGKPVVGGIISKSFISADQTITSGGTLTLAHGMGVNPSLYQLFMKCTSAENGFSIGDTTPVWTGSTAGNTGVSITSDTTNIYVQYGSNGSSIFNVPQKGGGSAGSLSNANWVFIVKAFA